MVRSTPGLAVGVILAAFLITAPVVPGMVTKFAGILAILSLFFGWKPLSSLYRDEKLLLGGFLLYVGFALLSLMNNSDFDTATWRFERYHPFLFAIPMLGMFIRFGQPDTPRLVICLFLAAAAIAGLSIYQQYWLGIIRTGIGSGFNPNTYGHLASIISVSLYAAVIGLNKSMVLRGVLLAGFLLASYGVFASGSRGSILAELIAIFVLSSLVLRQPSVSRRARWWVQAGTLLFVAVLIVAMGLADWWAQHWEKLIVSPLRYLQGDFSDVSISARSTMLMGAWNIWLANPVIGTGLGDGQADFEALVAAGKLPDVFGGSNHIFHNSFADTLATTGILGTIAAIFAVFLIPLWLFGKRLRQWHVGDRPFFYALAGIGLVVNLFIFAFSNSWLHLRGLPYILGLMLLFVAGSRRSQTA